MDTVMSSVIREANNSLMPSHFWLVPKSDQNQQHVPLKQGNLYTRIPECPQSPPNLLAFQQEIFPDISERYLPRSHKQKVLDSSSTSTKSQTLADQRQQRPQSSPPDQTTGMNYPTIVVSHTEDNTYNCSPGHSYTPAYRSGASLQNVTASRPSHQCDRTHTDVNSPIARLSFSCPSSPGHIDNRTSFSGEPLLDNRHLLDEDLTFETHLKTNGYLDERGTHLETFAREYLEQDEQTVLNVYTDNEVGGEYLGISSSLNSHHKQNWPHAASSLRREVTMHEINSISSSIDGFDVLNDGSIKYEDSDYSNASMEQYTARCSSDLPHIVTPAHISLDNTPSTFTHSLSQAVSTPTWSSSASPMSQTANDSARASPTDMEDNQEKSEAEGGKSKIKGGLKPRGAQNLPPCRICGNMASGLHFGVNTCEACNEFFRRRLKRGATYYCSKNRECQVYGKKRNACSYCRYQRCLEMGMSRDAIKTGRYSHKTRTEYAMEVEKFKMREVNRAEMEKHQVLVADLVKYHDKYVKVTTRIPDEELLANQKKYLQLYHTQREHERRHPPLKTAAPNKRLLADWTMAKEDLSLTMHDAEMTEHWLRNYINFAKNVPGFKELVLSDQASLVRGSWFEFWFLGAFRGYNNDLQVVAYPNGRCFHREEIQKVFGQEYTDFSFYLAERMRSLEVTPEVMVLIKTVCLTFPDRTPLENKQAVDKMHWLLVSCLLHTLEKNKPTSGNMITFPLVVSKLVELRTLTDIAMRAHKSALFQDVLKDSPLLCEMVDTKTRYVACIQKSGPQATGDV